MELRIVDIRKEFSRFPALHGISLDIASGELLALLGPSGSGKTTLLRLIAGLEQPTSGRIYFGRDDASERTVQERNVGFVFQHFALFRHMTVRENIGFGLRIRPLASRPSRSEIDNRVDELLELIQLGGLGERYPSQLSGGQRQRVALARALAIAPKVLLLDEPFGALDAQVRRDLRRWLRAIHEQTGHTTVFVTHDQEEALELADRVVVMSQGRIEQVGSAEAVYDRPVSPFVASFIGDANTLAASIDGDGAWIGRQRIRLIEKKEPGSALLVFRPHDVRWLEEGEGEMGLTGIVAGSRRVGGSHRVELSVETHNVEIDVPQGRTAPKPGARIRFRPEHYSVFPASSAGRKEPWNAQGIGHSPQSAHGARL